MSILRQITGGFNKSRSLKGSVGVMRLHNRGASANIMAKRCNSSLRNDIAVEGEDELKITVKPIPRINEALEVKRARLLYQSRKRGILETDLLLSRFADKYLKTMTMEEMEEYDKLLDMPDWDIYYWATRDFETTPMKKEWENSKILKMLQEFSVNPNKEILRMPDIN